MVPTRPPACLDRGITWVSSGIVNTTRRASRQPANGHAGSMRDRLPLDRADPRLRLHLPGDWDTRLAASVSDHYGLLVELDPSATYRGPGGSVP